MLLSEPRPHPHAYPRLALPVQAEADVDAGTLPHIPAAVRRRAIHRQAVGPGAGSLAGDDGGTVRLYASWPHFMAPILASRRPLSHSSIGP